MEERPPDVPQPIPEIPKGALWLSLGIPPVVALLASTVIAIFHEYDAVPFSAAVVCILTAMRGLGEFDGLIARRYQGNSAIFLSWAYFLGQAIVCAALGIGVLVIATLIAHASR
jgi:hypothetical protein